MKWLVILFVLLLGAFGVTKLNSPDQGKVLEEPDGSDNIEIPEDTPTKSGVETEKQQETPATSGGNTLDLSGRQLSKVPSNVFNERNITHLDLSNNQLTGALQAEVRHLQDLEVLNLSDNRFTGVPAEVGQLTKLTVLDLRNNELTGLPHEIANLKSLKTLDLRGNNPSESDLGIIKEALPHTTILLD